MATIVSCDKASVDPSSIVEPNDTYPVVTTLVLNNVGDVIEGDTLFYTLSINKPIDRSLTFAPVVISSGTTLVNGDDYHILGSAIIDPWNTSTDFMIETFSDGDYEEAKTLSFTFIINSLAEKYLVHPDNVFPTTSVSVKNLVSDDLNLEFSWATDIDLGFGVYSTSNNVDFDVFISEVAGFDINDPWASPYSSIMAATGDHPEVITLTEGDLPDGDYVFWSELWSNAFVGYGVLTEIPVTTHAYKAGTLFNYEIAQDPADMINAESPGVADAPPGSDAETHAVLILLNVSGTTYTISDYAGNEIGSGKRATINFTSGSSSVVDNPTPRPSSIIKIK